MSERTKAKVLVGKLIALATDKGAARGEASNAALRAVHLIREHDLLEHEPGIPEPFFSAEWPVGRLPTAGTYSNRPPAPGPVHNARCRVCSAPMATEIERPLCMACAFKEISSMFTGGAPTSAKPPPKPATACILCRGTGFHPLGMCTRCHGVGAW